jgi:alpha-L-fucosidase
MDWWREARFGLFIHWGLYAIPAGRWGEDTGHGEWIRETARIPVAEYDQLLAQFNPVAFDADAWARMADEAGMDYVVITTKHHDGFALFDSAVSDFDVMSTPLRRDVMLDIARAFGGRGLRTCWYHSIMDWHHPDYLPRRGWEEPLRPAAGADFARYERYLHDQVTELLTNYGPVGVMWFDGEWEKTWNHERGQSLYDLCRRLQPDVIVNNRVDVGRAGMAGMTNGPGYAGDFGTPEQEVPATGFPGVDWESCITMNSHWGWNQADLDWKSTTELVRLLVDVVSKGGNLLLNVGPRADGSFPPQAVERLAGIGRWMKLHEAAIRGTQASPFDELPWGRCTQKQDGADTLLFLHVFDWPADGRLVIPGLGNARGQARLLATGAALPLARDGGDFVVQLSDDARDADCTVVELRLPEPPIVYRAPRIVAAGDAFLDELEVRIESASPALAVRYRLDGAEPGPDDPLYDSPILLRRTATLSARAFHEGRAVTPAVRREFRRELPLPALSDAAAIATLEPGLSREKYLGDWNALPNWSALKPVDLRLEPGIGLGECAQEEYAGLRFSGWMRVPEDALWNFTLESDDGARLTIGGQTVADLDGLHGTAARTGEIALAAGWHPIEVEWFNSTGGAVLSLLRARQGGAAAPIPAADFAHQPARKTVEIFGAAPSPQQLRWHQLEYYAFVHFNMNTFTGREWGEGVENPDAFAPSALDCRQWARVARDAGMKGIILTAKHHDGFCLWDSAYTEHDVGASSWRGGKGDVLRELSDACLEFGLQFGLYLSPWDRNHPDYGSPRYNEIFAAQLEEVLTRYGPVFEVWFDGANGEGPNGRRQEYDWDLFHRTVYAHQPEAIIFSDVGPGCRWVGNEAGYAGETNWATLNPDGYEPGAKGPPAAVLNAGVEGGSHWIPAECDVSIRPGWYYHPDQDSQVKTLEQLTDIWYGSVGRGANLLLNLPVDRRGLVHENDAARLLELRALLDATFDRDLARNAVFTPLRDEQRLTFDEAVIFDRVVLSESIEFGQRVREFAVEAQDENGSWVEIAAGTTIGNKRILRTAPVLTRALRVLILDAGAPALLKRPQLHLAPPATTVTASATDFLDAATVTLASPTPGVELRYTLDGSPPDRSAALYSSPITLRRSANLVARAFLPGKDGLPTRPLRLTHWSPADFLTPVAFVRAPDPGLSWQAWETGIQSLANLDRSAPLTASGSCETPTVDVAPRDAQCILTFEGFFNAPQDGLWSFSLTSDDGSRLWIGDRLVVDADGRHGPEEFEGHVGLRAGWHPIRVEYFNASGEMLLSLRVRSPDGDWRAPALRDFGR